MSAEFRLVISGPCFGCDTEMSNMLVGVLLRRPTTRSDGGAAALCSLCLDRAAGMILLHWRRLADRSGVTESAGGSSEPEGGR